MVTHPESVQFLLKKGYTKNQAVKNIPMASSTTVRCGKTAGFTGLVYLVIVSSSCKQTSIVVMRFKYYVRQNATCKSSRHWLTRLPGLHSEMGLEAETSWHLSSTINRSHNLQIIQVTNTVGYCDGTHHVEEA